MTDEDEARRPIRVMLRAEFVDEDLDKWANSMGLIRVDEECFDCGIPCVRTEQPVGLSGILNPNDRGDVQILSVPENARNVCAECASKRAYAIGDWETGMRYQFAHEESIRKAEGKK